MLLWINLSFNRVPLHLLEKFIFEINICCLYEKKKKSKPLLK